MERSTNYAMLVHLPEGYKAEQMRDALAAKIRTLPEALRHSLTWDQGIEMQDWKSVKMDAGIDIYFCDPHSPWQRGINENTVSLKVAPEGLIRKGWFRQQEVTPENTGRKCACLAFDVSLELPAPA